MQHGSRGYEKGDTKWGRYPRFASSWQLDALSCWRYLQEFTKPTEPPIGSLPVAVVVFVRKIAARSPALHRIASIWPGPVSDSEFLLQHCRDFAWDVFLVAVSLQDYVSQVAEAH